VGLNLVLPLIPSLRIVYYILEVMLEEEPKIFRMMESLCDYLSVKVYGFERGSTRYFRLKHSTYADFLSTYRSLKEAPLIWSERSYRFFTLDMKDRAVVGEALLCDSMKLPLLINHTEEMTRFSVLWRLENNI
jgi:hypothetical protein